MKGETPMQKRLTRAEVPVELTWNLEDLFPSPEAWEAELKAVQDDLPTVTQYKGRLGEGASVLCACLNAQEALYERIIRVVTYANLRSSEDGTNPVNQANYGRVAAMMANVNAALSFIDSEILALPDGTIERYLEEEQGLVPFKKNLFELLETKPHKLSPETEEALASLGEVHSAPYMIYQRSKSSDMQFESITSESGEELPVSFALYEDHYELSPNTDERRKAFQSFVKTLKQYKNTFAAVYATEVKKQVALARLRKYESVTHMLLQPQQVTLEMYNNLLDIIQAELAPHMRRYANLKKRVLGLDTMYHCDLKAPLDPDFSPKTTYEEASKIILEALQILGPEYTKIIQTALTERWVDLADNVGKSTGAFCSSPYGSHPFILITWTDTMRGAFVLAHELGHAGHFALANRYQRLSNTRPSMYFVEAPSTMNEMLLGHYILEKSTDPRMRRWVIMQFLGTYYHNFVTHLLEAELQRRVYAHAEAGKPITANTLCELKGDVLSSFWGDAVEIEEGASLTWMRQPHYYMGLYPYTYSAGLTASTAVAQLIREEGKPAAERWVEVLKAGGTMKPLELMKMAGVDMSKPDPIRNAVAYVGSLIEELERSFASETASQ
jgi:oligoendopeptidase F